MSSTMAVLHSQHGRDIMLDHMDKKKNQKEISELKNTVIKMTKPFSRSLIGKINEH